MGRYNEFENGAIYWHPRTGAHVVSGQIRELWAQMGMEAGDLGYPVGDPVRNPNKDGLAQAFQGGTVFQREGGRAYVVKGAILNKYEDLEFENSALGYPVSNEIPLRDGGALSRFENGNIYWSPQTGAHFVPAGQIFDAWGEEGWENGRYGYPTSDPKPIAGGGEEQEFSGGTIRLINGTIQK